MPLCHPTGRRVRRKIWGIFSFTARWSQVRHVVSSTHQTVNYTDVPLVLFQPQMHVLTHAVETAQVGDTSQLPVTFRNLRTHTHTHTLLKLVYPGENFTNYYETMNKVHTHAQTHRIPCYGIETACTIFWRGCRQHSGQRGVNPGTVARPLCCSLWLTPPPLLGRTWLQRK